MVSSPKTSLAGPVFGEEKAEQDAKRIKQVREDKDTKRAQDARAKKNSDADRAKAARENKADDAQARIRNIGGRAGVNRAEDRKAVGLQNEADRAKQARQDAAEKQAERIEKARGEGMERSERAANARAANQARSQLVREMTARVREHRVRMSEIARLEKIYQGRGDEAKMARVQALKKKENEAYSAVMARFESQLGAADFKSVRSRLKLGADAKGNSERGGR